MADPLTLQGEITPHGELAVEIPAEAPRGRVVLTLEAAPGDSDPLSQRLEQLFEDWGIGGEPVPIETLRELSLQCGLRDDELSRSLVADRDS